jgi:hypothetical protein
VTRSAVSAWRTTRRARWTRVLSSIATGGRPIGLRPLGDQSGVAIELDLMRCDLPRQVCARFGQSVRAVRDPPDNRLTLLGPLTTGRGSRVPVLIGASASLQLSL